MAMNQSRVIKQDRDALDAWKADQDKHQKQLAAYVRFDPNMKNLKEFKDAVKQIAAGEKKMAAIVNKLDKEEAEAAAWFKDAKTRGANTLGRIGGVLEVLKKELESSLAKQMA